MKPSGQQIDQTLELRGRLLDLLSRYDEPRAVWTVLAMTIGQLLVHLSDNEEDAWSNLGIAEQSIRSVFGDEIGRKKWPQGQ
jgi:hypothetical protein